MNWADCNRDDGLGVDWILAEHSSRVQKRNRNAKTGDWPDGESSVDAEWWKRQSHQPLHNGQLRRVNEGHSKVTEGKWTYAETNRGTQKGKIPHATINHPLPT